MILVPDIGGSYSTWKDQERFLYRGCSLELRYQTEPPHGDFIYSLALLTDRAACQLPLWIFGRKLFFFGPSLLLAESVPVGRVSGLKSVVVDLSGARYSRLDSWYRDPELTDQGLRLTRSHDGVPLLAPSTSLTWNAFCRGGTH